jgi:hypothetical protein
MIPKLIGTSLLALLAGATLAGATEYNAELQKIVSQCESNPACATEPSADLEGVSLVLNRGGRTLRIHCSSADNCVLLMARGFHMKIGNLPILLSSN